VGEARCRTCKAPIYPGALKCNECEGYQDWRRWFPFSQGVLAMLVALVSVIATGVPLLISALRTDGSDARASYLACSPRQIDLVLSNAGTQVAVLHGAKLKIREGKDTRRYELPLTIKPEGQEGAGQPFLAGGATRVFHVFAQEGDPLVSASPKSTCEYQLFVDVLAFDQKPQRPLVITCPCNSALRGGR